MSWQSWLVNENLSWTVGSVSVERVEENIVDLAAKFLVPDLTADHVERHHSWTAPYFSKPEDGRPVLRLSIHSFVVRSGETTIVVDTCIGPDPEHILRGDPGFGQRLDRSLEGGLGAVDVVVCTHLHFDHVGWNTTNVDGVMVPTFPNARYLVTAQEMEELDDDNGSDEETDKESNVREASIQPLQDAGVLDVIELTDGVYEITEEVSLLATPGHTAGHVSVLIQSGGASALSTGDAFHTPIQISHPELGARRVDTDSDQSTATRHALIERFVDSETVILGTHFVPPTAGVLRRQANDHNSVWFSTDRADSG